MQEFLGEIDGHIACLRLPSPDVILMPGVKWGSFEEPLTPAFWVSQAWMSELPEGCAFNLGKCLAEEVVYCLLGGHGAPAEIGLAAARRVCGALSETGKLSFSQISELLREPLLVSGRYVRYRFANQRSRYLFLCLEGLRQFECDELSDIELRDKLQTLPGIGPKTASWIVRNHRGSDGVAILDIHIVRACEQMGVFPPNPNLASHYAILEKLFLCFCTATGSRASVMDATMWSTMRRITRPLLQLLIDRPASFKAA